MSFRHTEESKLSAGRRSLAGLPRLCRLATTAFPTTVLEQGLAIPSKIDTVDTLNTPQGG